ncbi:MAG: hypothetical protein KF699_17010 [Phycisphaeraceae bacterium]|nr:hypothetical protein [Phycisphaeraceae bacterium]
MAKASGIKAGQAYVALGTDNTAFTKGLDAAQKRLKAFGAAVTALGAAVTAVGGAGLGGMAKAAKAFSVAGDKIDKASIRTGLSAEAISELAFAAEQSGASLEDLETGFRSFQRTLGDAAKGAPAAAAAITGIGLSIEGLLAMEPDAQFDAIADAIGSIRDPALRTEAAMGLLGRGGASLIPMLEGGATAIANLRREAKALGLTFSREDAKAAAALSDALNGLNRQFKALWQWIGSAIAPAMTEAIRLIQPVLGAVVEWVRANKPLIATIGLWSGVIAAAGVAITSVGVGIALFGAVLGGIGTVLAVAGTAIAGIVAAVTKIPVLLLAVGAGAMAAFTDMRKHAGTALAWIQTKLGALRDFAAATWKGMADALANGDINLAAKVLWAGLEVAWAEGAAALMGVWARFSTDFLTTIGEIRTGTLAIWSEMTSAMDKAVWEMVHSSLDGLTKLKAELKSAHTNVTGWVADQMLMTMADLDPNFDLEAARKIRSGNDAAQLERIGETRDKELKERGEDFANLAIEQGSRLEGELSEIGDKAVAAQKALTDANAKITENAKAELDAAKARLDVLIEEARLRRQMTEEGRRQLEQAQGIQRAAGRLIGAQSSFGSFSAGAVQAYRPDDVRSGVERTAEATEALESIAGRISHAVDRMANGLSFA